MPNILLGITGSVAAILTKNLALRLQSIGEVRIIFTRWGEWFVPPEDKQFLLDHGVAIYRDEDEWPQYFERGEGPGSACDRPRTWRKTDPVLHIDLRRWASCLVIAPLTANTLAKMAHGFCDNLLTSVYRAWDHNRPVILAPAMNTTMWENPPTADHLDIVKGWKGFVVDPVKKELACGDIGIGAMADVEDIARLVEERLR
jgi:phosphopantothenoylcysteine decarboxylase